MQNASRLWRGVCVEKGVRLTLAPYGIPLHTVPQPNEYGTDVTATFTPVVPSSHP